MGMEQGSVEDKSPLLEHSLVSQGSGKANGSQLRPPQESSWPEEATPLQKVEYCPPNL